MRNSFFISLLCFLAATAGGAADVPASARVKLETSEGDIVMQLDGRRAPFTVANFLALVDEGYYDGKIFHRVIPDFMIQGGGYDRDFESDEPEDGIPNESGNGLKNLRGTVAMARLAEPHTASAQFFINIADNRSLDPQPDRWGYAVFGYVTEGMEVVDKIASMRTGPGGPFGQDVPFVPVIINKATRLGE